MDRRPNIASAPSLDKVLFWASFHDHFGGDQAFCRALIEAESSGVPSQA